MVGFEYCGKTTEDIIDTPLLLVSYDSDGALGSNRSKLEGDITISRPITNEYGTLYDPLSFSYALIKQDFEPFTVEEQVAVERWLTSPKLSSELTIINCEGGEYSYFGLFTSTNWQVGGGGFIICSFTFQVNGAYAYRHINQVVWEPIVYDEENPGQIIDTLSRGDFTINCLTDELEEYIYPTLTFEPVGSDNTASFTLYNRTDQNKMVKVTTNQKIPVSLDCKRCRAFTLVSLFQITNLKFKDLNWQDVDDVYWPRLINGENNFHIDGTVRVIVDYFSPFKKVGGWLI